MATRAELGSTTACFAQETFDHRFLRACKLNIADICMHHQRETMEKIVTGQYMFVICERALACCFFNEVKRNVKGASAV